MMHIAFIHPLPFTVIVAVFGAILFVSWLAQPEHKTHSEIETDDLNDPIL